jgi:hypothetical protein
MYDDDVDGEFDVVGYTDQGEPVMVGRGAAASRGRPGASRSMQRGGGGRNSQALAMGRGASAGRNLAQQRGGMGGYPFPSGTQVPPWLKGGFGVHGPSEQLHVMPLVPQTNNGIFTATITSIEFIARPQKPFRGERLITSTVNSGTTAAGTSAQSTGIFVGVDLQQVEAGNIPVSTWAATAFGVRLAMVDALPGIEIRIPCVLVGTLTSPDTVAISFTVLGRVLAG